MPSHVNGVEFRARTGERGGRCPSDTGRGRVYDLLRRWQRDHASWQWIFTALPGNGRVVMGNVKVRYPRGWILFPKSRR